MKSDLSWIMAMHILSLKNEDLIRRNVIDQCDQIWDLQM